MAALPAKPEQSGPSPKREGREAEAELRNSPEETDTDPGHF